MERGAAAVEFAIVTTGFVMLLTMIVGFGHWLYSYEMLADATRAGARMAVVCDKSPGSTTKVRNAIRSRVPQLALADSEISIKYLPDDDCDKTSCQAVEVSIKGATYTPMIPFLPGSFGIPPFTTSLPRESMESVDWLGRVNPVCS